MMRKMYKKIKFKRFIGWENYVKESYSEKSCRKKYTAKYVEKLQYISYDEEKKV